MHEAMSDYARDKALLKHETLTDEQRALVTEIEALGEAMEAMQRRLLTSVETDGRWVAIGTTDLQVGKMCWLRAVLRPKKF